MTAVRGRYDTCHWASVRPVSALESLRRYTRLTVLGTMPVIGGIPFLFAVADGGAARDYVPLAVGVAVLLTVHWRRVRAAIAEPAAVRPWRPTVAWLAAGTALMAYALVRTGDPGSSLWAFLPAMFVAELQYGRATAAAWRLGGLAATGVGAAATATLALSGAPEHPGVLVALFCTILVVTLGLPLTELIALRQWRLALELDQARRDAAELGATRERLRFAEDLHDILGHALEVVSLKAELATRLGPVDPDRAHAELVEVQRLSRGALQDVRELARGQRSTDLDAELTGARGLLASAGIDCVVDVEPAEPRHSELLGRVLREAVTNLLRHADTRHCWVTVRATTLSVVNDGVGAAPAAGAEGAAAGTGLAGLARRVTAAGGTFTAGPGERPGTFEVTAVLT